MTSIVVKAREARRSAIARLLIACPETSDRARAHWLRANYPGHAAISGRGEGAIRSDIQRGRL